LRCRLLTTALAATTFLSFPLGAQQFPSLAFTRSNTARYFFGLALDNTSLSGNATNGRTYSGGGLSGDLGYGFTPEFAAFIDGSAAILRRGGTGRGYAAHVDIGLRYHFANPARRFVPFAELALTQRALIFVNILQPQSQTDIEAGSGTISGVALTVGAGGLYFVHPRWALRGGARFTTGSIEIATAENGGETVAPLNAQSVRFSLGVSWFRDLGP